jgi:hypothetical protein
MHQEERTNAIARLARAERGRRSRQAFLSGLSSVSGLIIRADQLLDLDTTDEVRAGLSAGYASAIAGQETSRRVFFTRAESQAALQIAESLANPLAEERVLLWLKQSEDCGAVILTAGQVLKACEAIRAFDGDAVAMLSEGRTQGFIFDKNKDDLAETFEVSVWGSVWLGAATRLGFGPTERRHPDHPV